VTIKQQYKQEPQPREFEFQYRNPWDWAIEIIKEPCLKNHFVWEPERTFQWSGMSWEWFYDEPWSGDAWWNAQVSVFQFSGYSLLIKCYYVYQFIY
jgi:hypothetical protein